MTNKDNKVNKTEKEDTMIQEPLTISRAEKADWR